MKINIKKSTVMLFNVSRTMDFLPELNVGGENLEVVLESRILGFRINDSLYWDSHVTHICKRAHSKVWVLRRMMQLGLDHEIILDVFYKEIR